MIILPNHYYSGFLSFFSYSCWLANRALLSVATHPFTSRAIIQHQLCTGLVASSCNVTLHACYYSLSLYRQVALALRFSRSDPFWVCRSRKAEFLFWSFAPHVMSSIAIICSPGIRAGIEHISVCSNPPGLDHRWSPYLLFRCIRFNR